MQSFINNLRNTCGTIRHDLFPIPGSAHIKSHSSQYSTQPHYFPYLFHNTHPLFQCYIGCEVVQVLKRQKSQVSAIRIIINVSLRSDGFIINHSKRYRKPLTAISKNVSCISVVSKTLSKRDFPQKRKKCIEKGR